MTMKSNTENKQTFNNFGDFGKAVRGNIFRDPIPSPMMYDKDGVDHINIWGFGETELGRQLSTQYRKPFVHEHFGRFNTIDGLWHWISSFERDDRLRHLSDKQLKMFSSNLTRMRVPHFRFLILDAIWQRINQDKALKKMMIESFLPFTCYYYHRRDTSLPRMSITAAHWLIPGYTEIRMALKENRLPSFYNNRVKLDIYEAAVEQIKIERDRRGIVLDIADEVVDCEKEDEDVVAFENAEEDTSVIEEDLPADILERVAEENQISDSKEKVAQDAAPHAIPPVLTSESLIVNG